MWTLFKKELRENAVWLLGAFVLLFVFLEWAAWKNGWSLLFSSLFCRRDPYSDPWGYGGSADQSPIPHSAWLMMCCLWASAIAACQVFGEKVRQTWPLLVQLPIARERIILAKLLSGLTVYVIPLLALALLIVFRLSTPGVYPGPFSAWAASPLVWPSLAGMVVLLAVFAASFRQARWFGTKWILLICIAPGLLLSELATRHFAVYSLAGASWLFSSHGNAAYEIYAKSEILKLGVTTLLACLALLWAILDQAKRREY
jgi:hypothetical protein